jgi:CubicO group peptidase (beta-lactamase class C family)
MSDPAAVRDARALLVEAIAGRIFPAAVANVGDSRSVLWSDSLGTLTFDAAAPPASASTIFDLASLTKPLATTTVVLDLVARARLALSDPVGRFFGEWRGPDRADVTIADLLEHASGLPARLIDAPPIGRREFEHDICAMPLEYPPRSRSIYSDLGFILLGFIAADRGGQGLDRSFASLVAAAIAMASDEWLGFEAPLSARGRTAPTMALPEDVRRGRRLVGRVHDNYAAALGGVAGHAGLFGTAGAVAAFARVILRAARGEMDGHEGAARSLPASLLPDMVRRATTKSTVAGSSRALGWDTMLPASSCGAHLSPSAFGHVGFTGTSLWIDPERDRYYVLLTNRACGGGTKEEMLALRRAFHDALVEL